MTISAAATRIPSAPSNAGVRTLSFVARHGRGLVGLLRLQAPDVGTDFALHQRFKDAVAAWVKEDPVGKAIWNTCNDGEVEGALQIGDLAMTRSFDDAALQARLDKVGVSFVSFDLRQNAGDCADLFDSVLIDTRRDA